MKSIVTRGIVLSRTNFEESDRIITILTLDQGKVRLMAKGTRRIKSKLAGGIELFSVNSVTFLPGRKEIGTLVSSRMDTHYGRILEKIERTMLGYELLKSINRLTEDGAGSEYYELLLETLKGLNEHDLDEGLAELWFTMQLLKITGHSPNLLRDCSGRSLAENTLFVFSYDDMAFQPADTGQFSSNHIKLLRLGMGLVSPQQFKGVLGAKEHVDQALGLARSMLRRHVHV